MHFRLQLDLPRASLDPSGGCRELSDVLAFFAGSLAHGTQSIGPVCDLGGSVVGQYILVNRPPVTEEA